MSANGIATPTRTVIIGAGPAGLTAAYELSKQDVESVILEADAVVGGISRTAQYKGYLFDIGGHRFFTKVSLVDKMWREVLGKDLISRPRLSRIYYRSRFFQYPLEPMDALFKLGILETIRCVYSYFLAKLFPELPEDNFESWVSNRFGRRLFSIFFRSYTEKVWGIPCKEIGADWAAQRIKGLSLPTLILSALGVGKKPKGKDRVIKTLIRTFEYPRKGPGMMWSKTKDIVESRGSKVVFNAPVSKIRWEPGRVTSIHAGGKTYDGDHFISSMPIRELLESLDPAPPQHIVKAASAFHYRDFLTVALICKRKDMFPDNWIYIHDPLVKVGRIQNYNNWSPEMVPDAETTCLGLEYFCFEGDGLWNSSNETLIELAKKELEHLGLATRSDIVDGTVVRMPKAYPIYDSHYREGLRAVREFLAMVPNLQLVGRNGMHRYNNQDHSMLTAILAARNVLGANYDLWQVNADSEYGEEGGEITEEELKHLEASQPLVPQRAAAGVGR